jgi:hypothetical protein
VCHSQRSRDTLGTVSGQNGPIAARAGRRARLEHWFNSEPLALQDLGGKVALVCWFMAPSYPFCSATAPALNRFDYEPLDVETVRG